MSILNESWILGRKNELNHVRFFPNPGFKVSLFGYSVKYSNFYGFAVGRIK